jgi:hypothetical protein
MWLKAWRDKMCQIESARQDGVRIGMRTVIQTGVQKTLELIKSGKTPEEIMKIMGIENRQ